MRNDGYSVASGRKHSIGAYLDAFWHLARLIVTGCVPSQHLFRNSLDECQVILHYRSQTCGSHVWREGQGKGKGEPPAIQADGAPKCTYRTICEFQSISCGNGFDRWKHPALEIVAVRDLEINYPANSSRKHAGKICRRVLRPKSCIQTCDTRPATSYRYEDFIFSFTPEIEVSHMHQDCESEGEMHSLKNLRYSARVTQSEHQYTGHLRRQLPRSVMKPN